MVIKAIHVGEAWPFFSLLSLLFACGAAGFLWLEKSWASLVSLGAPCWFLSPAFHWLSSSGLRERVGAAYSSPESPQQAEIARRDAGHHLYSSGLACLPCPVGRKQTVNYKKKCGVQGKWGLGGLHDPYHELWRQIWLKLRCQVTLGALVPFFWTLN
jgi:hypothetical protein